MSLRYGSIHIEAPLFSIEEDAKSTGEVRHPKSYVRTVKACEHLLGARLPPLTGYLSPDASHPVRERLAAVIVDGRSEGMNVCGAVVQRDGDRLVEPAELDRGLGDLEEALVDVMVLEDPHQAEVGIEERKP